VNGVSVRPDGIYFGALCDYFVCDGPALHAVDDEWLCCEHYARSIGRGSVPCCED
jgi:hypothetical protein